MNKKKKEERPDLKAGANLNIDFFFRSTITCIEKLSQKHSVFLFFFAKFN